MTNIKNLKFYQVIPKQTYREALQIQIKALQTIYDNANGLRDVVDINDHKGKAVFNKIRTVLPELWGLLQGIDNSIPDNEAAYKLNGNYSVIVGEGNI